VPITLTAAMTWTVSKSIRPREDIECPLTPVALTAETVMVTSFADDVG
jgi:hypothetical protein